MLATDLLPEVVGAEGRQVPPPLTLRMRTSDGRIVDFELAQGKNTLGSGPRCSIRFTDPGVQPLHCLVTRDKRGVMVRPWAQPTLINGTPFVEVRPSAGDRLTIGPVELAFTGTTVEEPPLPRNCAEIEADVEYALQATAIAETIAPEPAAPEASSKSAAVVEAEAELTPDANEEVTAPRLPRRSTIDGKKLIRKLKSKLRAERKAREQFQAELDVAEQRCTMAFEQSATAAAELQRLVQEHTAKYEAWSLQNRELEAEVTSLKGHIARLDAAARVASDTNSELIERCQQLGERNSQLSDENARMASRPDANAYQQLVVETPAVTWGSAPKASESAEFPKATGNVAVENPFATPRHVEVVDPQTNPFGAAAESEFSWTSALPPRDEVAEGNFSAPNGGVFQSESEQVAGNLEFNPFEPGPFEAVPYDPVAEAYSDPFATGIDTTAEFGRPVSSGASGLWSSEPSHDDTATVSGPEGESAANWTQPDAELEDPFASATSYQSDAGETPADLPEPAGWLQPTTSVVEPDLNRQPSVSDPTLAARPASNSYIERFAHLFADDENALDEPSLSSPQRTEQQGRGDSFGASRVAQPTPSTDSDEESIEDYMAKLLQRVRGDAGSSAPVESPGVSAAYTQSPPADERSGPLPFATASQPVAETTQSMATDYLVDPNAPMAPLRAPGPAERLPDFQALRDLANETARHAIAVHATRTYRESTITKVIVSALAAMTGLWLMLQAPTWLDVQFISAGVLMLVAAYWGGQSLSTLIESIRASSYDGPGFDWDEDAMQREGALPIDVDQDRW